MIAAKQRSSEKKENEANFLGNDSQCCIVDGAPFIVSNLLNTKNSLLIYSFFSSSFHIFERCALFRQPDVWLLNFICDLSKNQSEVADATLIVNPRSMKRTSISKCCFLTNKNINYKIDNVNPNSNPFTLIFLKKENEFNTSSVSSQSKKKIIKGRKRETFILIMK
jgi:hypothetical protein